MRTLIRAVIIAAAVFVSYEVFHLVARLINWVAKAFNGHDARLLVKIILWVTCIGGVTGLAFIAGSIVISVFWPKSDWIIQKKKVRR